MNETIGTLKPDHGPSSPLSELRDHFLATSTLSMPIAGMLYWGAVALASLLISPVMTAYVVLFGSGMIFPLAALIDRARGRRVTQAGTKNPVVRLFLSGIVMIVLVWPLVILAARASGDPTLIVLGGAVLMGLVWIPYGWAADDPAGVQHAIGRAIACYAAFIFAPSPYKATAICIAVLGFYLFSLVRMRRPEA